MKTFEEKKKKMAWVGIEPTTMRTVIVFHYFGSYERHFTYHDRIL